MATATAARLKKALVEVPITGQYGEDGKELTIRCRKPDLIQMVTEGLFTPQLLEAVQKTVGLSAEQQEALSETTTMEDAKQYATFIDTWACAAAISPRLVLTQKAAELDENALWVDDLDLATKVRIMTMTTTRKEALKGSLVTFRSGEGAGAEAGQDGEKVPDTPVGPVTH